MDENRPANVPQRCANQATHARYALHAFFLSAFVSIENKGSVILIPKLEVVSSSTIASPIFPLQNKKSANPEPDEKQVCPQIVPQVLMFAIRKHSRFRFELRCEWPRGRELTIVRAIDM